MLDVIFEVPGVFLLNARHEPIELKIYVKFGEILLVVRESVELKYLHVKPLDVFADDIQ